MTAPTGISCPCKLANLRVVRTTHVPGGIERERCCPLGHRVVTIEVTRLLTRTVSRRAIATLLFGSRTKT